MRQSISLLTMTVPASTDLTACRFVTTAGTYPVPGESAAGVARSNAVSGDVFSLDVYGTAVIEAGEPIAKDAGIEVGVGGVAMTLAAGARVAVALEAASAAGQMIEVLLTTDHAVALRPPPSLITAGAVLAANRFVTAAGIYATAAAGAIGVTRSAAALGAAAPVDVSGEMTIEAADVIAVGGAIEVGANGTAALQSTGTVVARALSEATQAGDLIKAVMIPN